MACAANRLLPVTPTLKLAQRRRVASSHTFELDIDAKCEMHQANQSVGAHGLKMRDANVVHVFAPDSSAITSPV